jgi:hypothetical protein
MGVQDFRLNKIRHVGVHGLQNGVARTAETTKKFAVPRS